MAGPAEYRSLWDGSAPGWVLVRLGGRLFPFNTATGTPLILLDEEDGLTASMVEPMLGVGRPVIDHISWQVRRSTPEGVLRDIETIRQRVRKIRTHTTRAAGEEALRITAPLEDLRTRSTEPHGREVLIRVARQVWAIHLDLLRPERAHGR